MSKVALSGNASGTGTFTIASPNGSTDRTVVLPDSNGTILTTATAGVPVNGPAFSAYQSTAQALTLNVWTKAQLQSEEFDTNGCFDNTTNYRFTPTVAGYYQITANFFVSNTATANYISIYKNGSLFKQAPDNYATNAGNHLTALIYFNGSTDYVEMYVKTGVSQNTTNTAYATFFQGALIRSAT